MLMLIPFYMVMSAPILKSYLGIGSPAAHAKDDQG